MGGKRKKHKPTYKPVKRRVEPSEPPLLVFISSRGSMTEERKLVHSTIKSIPITRPWSFEYTSASSQAIEDSYLSEVRRCEIFLLLLGKDYSDRVAREYQTAIETKKPILAFIDEEPKEQQQHEFINLLPFRSASYYGLDHLHDLVFRAICDQVIRLARETGESPILPNDIPKIIQQLQLQKTEPKEMMGYMITGMEEGSFLEDIFRIFYVPPPPENLGELHPTLEPVYIENFAEMEEVSNAVRKATERGRQSTGDKQKAFERELKKQASDIATRYAMRKVTDTPEPRTMLPGGKYFIWALEPSLARLYKVLRLEGVARQPVQIERVSNEFLFKDWERFNYILDSVKEATANANDDNKKFMKLLYDAAENMRKKDEEEDSKKDNDNEDQSNEGK